MAAPIVLLRPRAALTLRRMSRIALPISESCSRTLRLHHLLMQECRFPLTPLSGNRSDEPIAIANDEAVVRLKDIADHFPDA